MRAVAWLALLAVCSMTLSGCSGKPKSHGSGLGEGAFTDLPPVASGKGLIRGIVVSPALVPVVGATVQILALNLSKSTDANGAFVFLDLAPGTYFLQTSKLGWTTVQQSVDVVADVEAPAIAKVALEQVPGQQPRAFTMALDGFISCSIGTY